MTLRRLVARLALPLWAVSAAAGAAPAESLRHELSVSIHPESGRLEAEDRITLPADSSAPAKAISFVLHRGLSPSLRSPGARLEALSSDALSETFRLVLPPGARTFTLAYGGEISHPLESQEAEYARGFRETPGLISSEGVFLAQGSLWYPLIEGEDLLTFTLDVRLPRGWESVSQGSRTRNQVEARERLTRWESPEPQTEIYLVAGRFTEYSRRGAGVEELAFLRSPDEALAGRYLAATGPYIRMYEGMLGPYPYSKFALVENFWETGYGMPSFTLLGPRVLRFPFILTTSYPHEILHNWWGNGVYPDAGGNWTEGLTAYLSDHLFKEQQGEAAAYREETLQKYADYAVHGKDFPLTRFLSRHDSATEAVGYGKGLMFFHMLRLELGDEGFLEGLREFYRREKFRRAGFAELRRALEAKAGKDLSTLFRRWVEGTGAPRLKVSRTRVSQASDGRYRVTAVLEQGQPGAAYVLRVPVALTVEGGTEAVASTVAMTEKRVRIELSSAAKPLRLDVDPEFDVFRTLDPQEIPPALSGALGSPKIIAVLPSAARKTLVDAYRELARTVLPAQGAAVEVRLDSDLKKLPQDRAVWILGWENRWLPEVNRSVAGYGAQLAPGEFRVGKEIVRSAGRPVALASRFEGSKGAALGFLAADDPEALPGLGRKLPHYHKWSWLVFEGKEPANTGKGRWSVSDSPMTVSLVGGAVPARGTLARRKPLATLPPPGGKAMLETIRFLADERREGRGFGSAGLEAAAEYVAEKFREAGLRPGGEDGSYFQRWTDRGGDPEREAALRNVIGLLPSSDSGPGAGSVVLGAHYDHLGHGWPDARVEDRGKLFPGADDNASGVAVLLRVAGEMAGEGPRRRPVAFAAFSGEEAGRRGSKRYVSAMEALPGRRAAAMVNLDTVGRLGDRPLLVLGTATASGWATLVQEAGAAEGVPVDVVATDPGGSDQLSFQEEGVPAIQLLTAPHLDYHRPTDTADKIDERGLEKVAGVVRRVVEALVADPSLPGAVHVSPAPSGPVDGRSRRVSLGTVPDLTYEGEGVRLSGVAPGSPAEGAGLREGDVVIALGSRKVGDLRDFSAALKGLEPGSSVGVTFRRDGVQRTVEARLQAR